VVGNPRSSPERRSMGALVPVSRLVIAAFLAMHASIFMAGHLLFLTILAPGNWTQHLHSPLAFVQGFVIPSGVWIPLAGLFAVRAFPTPEDTSGGREASHRIGRFCARTVLMHRAIHAAGFLSLIASSPFPLLVLPVAFRTAAEAYSGSMNETVSARVSRTPRD